MVPFAAPPGDDARDLVQSRKGDIAHEAEQIEVGVFGVEFALGGRAVKNHADEILASVARGDAPSTTSGCIRAAAAMSSTYSNTALAQ